MAKAHLNGVGIHYQRLGRGADLVMVHGLGTNLAFWGLAIAPRLAQLAHVTLYDLRGHGLSEMPRSGYTARDMAQDLDSLLDHLGIESAHVVGHSYGCAVAVEHAAAQPERIRSLTLADPVVPMLAVGESAIAELRRRIFELGTPVNYEGPGAVARRGRAAIPFSRPREEEFIPFSQWNGASRSAANWQRLLATTSAIDELVTSTAQTGALSRICAPVLVVFGSRSRYRALGRQLAYLLPDCRCATISGAGHFHPAVRPQEFTSRVAEFVASTERHSPGPMSARRHEPRVRPRRERAARR